VTAPQAAAAEVTPPGFSPVPPPTPGLDSGSTATIGLNSVTFEELRSQGLSVTQATRLLAHRERLGGFKSVDDLDQVAGFPPDLLATVKSRATL
jgi:DNA uptake protein ComE-like DNA-binding protein